MKKLTEKLVMLAFCGLSMGAINAQVCSIGTNTYATLDLALAAITDTTHTTIKLLDNITTDGGIQFSNRKITFDLNGKNLIFVEYVNLYNSVVDYTGTGNFKCFATTNNNGGFYVINVLDGSTLKLISVEINVPGGTNNSLAGIYCRGASTVIVNGDVKVTYGGNITIGIEVYDNSTVTVNGSITAADYGIITDNSNPGTKTVTVSGDVNTANGYGVWAYGATAITIDGKINAANYISLNDNVYTAADGIADSTKPNYLKYADGSTIVWVGNKATVYQITAMAGTGGSISPSGTVSVEEGKDTTFTFSANSGYQISQVLIDNLNNFPAVSAGSYTFTNVTANHKIEVYFSPITGISEATAKKMTIYPNPTNGQLRVSGDILDSGDREIRIYNVVGQVVFTSQLSALSPETTIDISHLSAGLYFLKVDGKMVKIVKE